MDLVVECLSGVVGLVALAAEAQLFVEQSVTPAGYGSRSASRGSISMVLVAAEHSVVSATSEDLTM